jgi:hypothetical protein
MWHKAIYALLLAALLAFTLLLLPGEQARAQRQEAEAVEVVNFPEVQKISGGVEVERPIPAALLVALPETISVPARPDDPAQWVEAGVLDSGGWSHAVLSLTGEIRGRGATGRVGALLVPDVAPVREALDRGRILFALEVAADVEAGAVWVESDQPRVELAFPRYRVYLYNTSERTVAVRLFVYLTQ